MSHFAFPRIHVRGGFWFNPGTGNNDSIDPWDSGTDTADSETVEPVSLPLVTSDDDQIKWMEQLDPTAPQPRLRAQWNYYGDMSFRFTNVAVTAIQMAPGAPLTSAEEDPLIGTGVFLDDAVMIDVNPEGFNTSQIFCESVSLKGTERALGPAQAFYSRKPTKACTRWINWYRNMSFHGVPDSSGAAGGVSATFQMGIPILLDDLDATSADVDASILQTGDSPVLRELIGRLTEGLPSVRLRGLIFRMNLYLCHPEYSDPEMAAFFAQGIQMENPGYGRMAGTIGLWYADEMASITLGRHLSSANAFMHSTPRGMSPAWLAPTVAQINREDKVVSLDVANTFPEDGPGGVKFNLGEAVLQVQSEGIVHSIGAIDYSQEAYEATCGMVDIQYADALEGTLEAGELAVATPVWGVLLSETRYMAATDDSCVYLNDGRQKNRDVDIRVIERGGSLTAPLQLVVEQWIVTPSNDPKNPRLFNTENHTVALDGRLRLHLNTEGSGCRAVRFTPADLPVSPTLNYITDFLMSARVLPKADFSAPSDEDLTWDLIYREIFRYYYVTLPAMNKRLNMKDPLIWQTPTAAQYLLKVTSEERMGSFNYMPRTRDLSDDRRELLQRWCRKVVRETTPAGAADCV